MGQCFKVWPTPACAWHAYRRYCLLPSTTVYRYLGASMIWYNVHHWTGSLTSASGVPSAFPAASNAMWICDVHELMFDAACEPRRKSRVACSILLACIRLLQELGWKRSDHVVSTKVFWGGEGPNDVGLSRKHIIEGTKVKRLCSRYHILLICLLTTTSISERTTRHCFDHDVCVRRSPHVCFGIMAVL